MYSQPSTSMKKACAGVQVRNGDADVVDAG